VSGLEDNVTTELRRILMFALTIAAVAVGTGRQAAAYSFDDIAGKWCGSVSSYTFTPAKMAVILYADNSRREYKVQNYQYGDADITVNWVRGDEKLFTKFGEFSSDNRLMIQLQNEAGPRREFRRCS
jgi:hypothetical protein